MVFKGSVKYIYIYTITKHTPLNKKRARGNQMPFFNIGLSNIIMTRTKLRNIFLYIGK